MDLPIAETADSPAPSPVAPERGRPRIWTVFLAYGTVALASAATALVPRTPMSNSRRTPRLWVFALLLLAATGCRRSPDMSQGGTELVFGPAEGAVATPALLQETQEKLARRLEGGKITARVNVDAGTARVLLPSSVAPRDVARAKELVRRVGKLQLREVDDATMRSVLAQLQDLEGTRVFGGAPDAAEAGLFTRTGAEAQATIAALRARLPPKGAVALQPPAVEGAMWSIFVLGPLTVDSDDVEDARVVFSPTNQPRVLLTLRREAAAPLEAMSRRLVGRRLAVTLDGEVVTAPLITEPLTNGRAEIGLGNSKDLEEGMRRANAMVMVLRPENRLPFALRLIEERMLQPANGGR